MIHREGKKILLLFFVLWASINVLTFTYSSSGIMFWGVLIISLFTFILITQFFRNPKRVIKASDNKILSPVDGKVVVIEQTFEQEILKQNMRQISVFMSPLNVHVTRYPISGNIIYSQYHPGKKLVAWHPKSSTENERTTVLIQNPKHGKILYRQIAGAMARRIVNYAKVGQKVSQGADSGFIKFGSRVDVFIPLDYKICVNLEQKVRGGQTVIAERSEIKKRSEK